jgi:DNA recombination protein RmuC
LGSGPELALAQQRATQLQAQLRDALQQLDEATKQKDAALEQLREESNRRASLEALSAQLPLLQKDNQEHQRTILALSRDKEALSATIEAERKGFEEKLRLLEDAKKALSEAFAALSGNALKSNSEQFLKLAQESLSKFQEGAKTELTIREKAIEQLVGPVKDALQRFDTNVHALEVAREVAYQGLLQQVGALLDTGNQIRSETSNLVQALRAPVVRGQWGEIQLRRVVEMAGMLNYCDFQEQKKVERADEESARLRPDLIVRLPGGKTIVVDAKAPVSNYLDAMALTDENERKAKLKAFARLVRDRVAELGRKSYWDQFEHSPELVVMFLPGDHYHSAALEQDPSLLEFGVEQKVLIATPINLIGLLRAVAYGWRQEAIATNAKEISELGAELYKRLADLSGHWVDLGNNLTRTVEAFNKAVGSLESRVLVSARRFKELGATPSSAEIEVLEPVERAPRALAQLRVLDLDGLGKPRSRAEDAS